MITDEEIKQSAKDAEWLGGVEGWTFNSLAEFREFARAIYQLGRQHQRESDASRVRFAAADFCGGAFETVMRTVAQSIEDDKGDPQ